MCQKRISANRRIARSRSCSCSTSMAALRDRERRMSRARQSNWGISRRRVGASGVVPHPSSLVRRHRSCVVVCAFKRRPGVRSAEHHLRAGVPDGYPNHGSRRLVGERRRRFRKAPIRNCLRHSRRQDWTLVHPSPRAHALAPVAKWGNRHGLRARPRCRSLRAGDSDTVVRTDRQHERAERIACDRGHGSRERRSTDAGDARELQ